MINSLSYAVWDTDERRGLSLKERVEMFSERETTLYLGDLEELARYDVFFLSFSDSGEPVLNMARNVRKTGEDVYMLLVSEPKCDVSKFFRPSIRPGGVLFRPLQNTHLREMLHEVVSEMKRLTQGDDISAFVFKSEGVSYRIPFRDILFFEANNKKVQIHTPGQELGYYDSLENLAASLPDNFVRCHRSYMVNIQKVEEFRSCEMELKLTGGYRIPLSRSQKNTIKSALLKRNEETEGAQ